MPLTHQGRLLFLPLYPRISIFSCVHKSSTWESAHRPLICSMSQSRMSRSSPLHLFPQARNLSSTANSPAALRLLGQTRRCMKRSGPCTTQDRYASSFGSKNQISRAGTLLWFCRVPPCLYLGFLQQPRSWLVFSFLLTSYPPKHRISTEVLWKCPIWYLRTPALN